MLEQAHREWGDGGGDVRVHVITSIEFHPQVSMLACRCGGELLEATPEDLTARWVEHGGMSLVLKDVPQDETTHQGQAHTALAAIRRFGADCSCTDSSDVRDCENYQPGDEAPDAFDEETE